jgi:hypothetical protein
VLECLGQAYSLMSPIQILGRANELHQFVKNTKDEGFIEIELKGNVGEPNVVIKRALSSKSKASTFYVNGRSSTGREVTQTMTELNIQVGNLWYGLSHALRPDTGLKTRLVLSCPKTASQSSRRCPLSNY